jgi:MoaA/NifB/PqqE/SkfB family radical SAM enzyme
MASKPQLDVHLYVTPRCNLSCPHCYYDAYDRTRNPEHLISLTEIGAVLTGLCDRFDADISLEGGEPFLRGGIDRLLAELDPDVLACITVTTNGTVKLGPSPHILRGLRNLRVSIDGHDDELQHELRGVELAPVLRRCQQLRDWDVPFTVRMTLWKKNVRNLSSIYSWVDENKFERLSLFEYQSSGRGLGQELLYGVSARDVDHFLDDLARLRRPQSLQLVTVNLAERRVEAVLALRDHLETGGFGVHELSEVPNCTVNYDGTVGISPWRVTAHGAPDVFTTTNAVDYLDTIEAAAAKGALQDESGCLSRIQIRCGR